MTKPRVLMVLLLINALLWGRALAEPMPDPVAEPGLEDTARMACERKGHTLRLLVISYDENAQPVGARAGCGEPKRAKA